MLNTVSPEQIEAQLKSILSHKFGVQESEINPNTKIVDDLGADSLDVVELCMECEKEFNIAIPDDKWDSAKTVQDVIQVIHSLIQ